MREFCGFIINSKLKNLKSMCLRDTNVDDKLCSIISDKTVVSFKLEEIDVSQSKVDIKFFKKFIN